MKKLLISSFISLMFMALPLTLQAEQEAPDIDETLLKCLLSGICPEEDQTARPAGVITELTGEVEFSSDLGLNYSPLTNGETVRTGYRISTGFESYITIDFGFGTLRIPPLTNFTIERVETSEQLRQMQIALFTGSVRARVTRPASIRGDFSVRTTPALSSIRGSEMQVEVTKSLSVITSAIDETAYVKGSNDAKETEVPEGYSVEVSADGTVGTAYQTPVGQVKEVNMPSSSAASNVNTIANSNSNANTNPPVVENNDSSLGNWPYALGAVIAVGLIVVIVYARRKKK